MGNSLRIAIAEDDADILRFFETVVLRLGHRVVAKAQNGRELVERCHTQDLDLIITDIHMPEMDGIEASRRICCERPVPVIVISSSDRTEESEGENKGHVVAFLVKPVKLSDLETAILTATGGASS
jgi:CheY-like chemotaxis protein